MINRDELLSGIKNDDPGIRENLEKVYNIDVKERLLTILEYFAERFPSQGSVAVLRAPGRVNIIGEHQDYNSLPVFPMAIDYDMMVALSPRDDLEIHAVNPEFPDRTFRIEEKVPPFETGDWGNYIKAGVQGIVGELGGIERLRGFNACFYGTVPVGAGLSSSSTMVVASAMASLEAGGIEMDPLVLSERMASAEWYVGTQGGGMDHAASILSEKGKALKIDFFPLRTRPVSLPPGYTIVVGNTMVLSTKTKESRLRFNLLPTACRAATAMLVAKYDLDPGKNKFLGDIYRTMGRVETLKALQDTFTRDKYTKQEVAALVGKSVEQLDRELFTTTAGELIPEPEGGFRVGARARHVITETIRVEESIKVIEAGDGEAFAEQMNGSWISCRDDFEISHPALEDLVSLARAAGSSGSRLTGAGWGGCSIHLVADEKVEQVMDALQKGYYEDAISKYPDAEKRYREAPENALLACRPSGGARVLF